MKKNPLHSVTNFLKSLTLAIVIVLASAVSTTKAQETTLKTASFNSIIDGIASSYFQY